MNLPNISKDLKSSFLNIIKSSRLSVRKISELSGVSKRTISAWLYEDIHPTVNLMEKVLNSIGFKVLIEETKEVNHDRA